MIFKNTFGVELTANRAADSSPSIRISTNDNNKELTQASIAACQRLNDAFEAGKIATASTSIKDGTFVNPSMRTGLADPNISDGRYMLNMITFDRYTILALYHGCWIFRRIIDKVSQDMWQSGIKINSDTDPNDLKRVYKRLNRLSADLIYATEQARLFGGAIALVMVDDGVNDLAQPLNLKGIQVGARISLLITDRWYGMTQSSEVVTDYRSRDFNKPKYYTFYMDSLTEGGAADTQCIKAHHSRVLRFTNRRAPKLIEQMLMGWGISELEHIYQDLMNHENTKASIASLLNKAVLEVVKVSGMRSIMQGLSAGNTSQQAAFSAQLSAITSFRTSNNLVFLDGSDSYEQQTYSFSGLSDILDSQKTLLAGAAEMPQVLLYGDTKGGMSSDRPAEMEFYASTINGKQESDLRNPLDKLLPIIFRAEGLEVPADLDYDFESIAGLTLDNKNSILNNTVDTTTKLIDAGLITYTTGLREIQEVQQQTGFGSNITEADFELAKKQDESDANVDTNENEDLGADDENADMATMLSNDSYTEAKDAILSKHRMFDKFRPAKQ